MVVPKASPSKVPAGKVMPPVAATSATTLIGAGSPAVKVRVTSAGAL